MKRILFLIAGLLALPLLADKPNVIVIMADDMGWECVSAYRDLIAKYNYPKANPGVKDHYTTPNIDKLADGGIVRDPADAPVGEALAVRVARARMEVRVESVEASEDLEKPL